MRGEWESLVCLKKDVDVKVVGRNGGLYKGAMREKNWKSLKKIKEKNIFYIKMCFLFK